MAFDGITIASIVKECNDCLIGSRIYKIAQPETDELLLTLKTEQGQKRLLISAGASLPLIYFTENNKPSPMTAPNFCMLLRKHLIGGRISKISMLGLERLINIEIETINEFNELQIKTLIIELMGRHSNILLTNSQNVIIDAMRHISSETSYREILPSRNYTLPNSDKFDFMAINNFEDFYLKLANTNFDDLGNTISNIFTGFSLSFVR